MKNFILDRFIEKHNLNSKDFFLPNKKNIFFVNVLDESHFYDGWNIIDISWNKTDNHPSYYYLSRKFPKKSAFKESYGENFYNNYYKKSYWNEIEYDLSFYLKTINIDYKKIIQHKYQAKIIAWNFFSYSMHSCFNFLEKSKINITDHYFFDFFNLKNYEYEVDKLLIYLKNNHKIIYSYWEIYYEEELLNNYVYWSYDYLKKIFESNLVSTKIYYTATF